MTDYATPEDMEDGNQEFERLLRYSAATLYRSADPADFLDWIAEFGPLASPKMASQVDPATGPVGLFFRTLGVHIYNQTPTPDHDFALHPLPKPERNQPCHCGSGKKYKHCCNHWDLQHSPLTGFNMLYYMLECTPKNAFSALPLTKVNPEALADVADQWLQQGKWERVLALLEPWFKPGVKLTQRHCWLFEALMDAYQAGSKPLKRKRLLQQVCETEDKQLRSAAWQRKAAIEMDAGHTASAWNCFAMAQQLDPNAPPLAVLELTLLCAEQKFDQAKARAAFWLARFKRSGGIPSSFLDLLAQCAQDPRAALRAAAPPAEDIPPALVEVTQLFKSAPVIAAHYTLDVHQDEARLQAKKALAKLEQKWVAKAQPPNPGSRTLSNSDLDFWMRAEDWLPLLQNKSQLWNSFEVLNDLVTEMERVFNAGGMQEHGFNFFSALLDRAVDLLDAHLAGHPPSTQLPWIFLDNRPALCLLEQKVSLLKFREGSSPHFIQYAERLIRLNPNDNHGIRDPLTTAYIANHQLQQAIVLASQHEDDGLCGVPLNHVLALYLNNQPAEALARLKTIAPRFEVAIKMLLAKSPKKPPAGKYGMTLGGKEEAWFYRESTVHLWQQQGALAWLKKSIKIR